jgi:uncharacterized SAM-binding protein YcdF (DUF218 family)
MCSYNLAVAEHAYILFRQKMADFVVLSGGVAHTDDLLITDWDEPEAAVFRDRMVEIGMDPKKIIVEDQSTNCGENVQMTKALLTEKDKEVASGIIVQKPYMERRALATAEKQWPEVDWQVSSPIISYDDYIANHDEERLINLLVGDTQRIIEYPKKGYQTEQEIPDDVKNTYDTLVKKGFTKHLIKED